MDAVRLEIHRHLFAAVAEEMGVALGRTAFSPNIKERLDYSCAVFDGTGEMIAQAAHIPVHLGSMPLSVEAALRDRPMDAGDVVLLNDPFRGGTHLPDLTVVAPVFLDGPGEPPAFHVANRAHHADIGGMAAGSMSTSREIYQEGLVVPPVKIVRGGQVDRDLLDVLLANVRTPAEREGDLAAQLASLRAGERRLSAIRQKYGREEVLEATCALRAYSERCIRRLFASIPAGTYEHEDALDDDGFGRGPIPIRVAIRTEGEEATFDFAGSAPEVEGPLNATLGITASAVQYVLLCLAGRGVPPNSGVLRPVRLLVPEGSILAARRPAAVAGGNVETSQRIVDVVLGAFARAVPARIGAASGGSMNNVLIGGRDPVRNRPFTYYETIGCGMGGRPGADGVSGVQTHMTNTRNTPVEALEHHYPFRIRSYRYRRGSGGAGLRRGGDGLVREYEILCPAEVSILSERRVLAPPGSAGGDPGLTGRNLLRRGDVEIELGGKVRVEVSPGDRIEVATPGGGGWGAPASEAP